MRVGLKSRSVHEYAEPFTARVAGQRAIDVWRRRERAPRVDRRVRHRRCPTSTITTSWFALCDSSSPRQRQVVILRYLADFDERTDRTDVGLLGGHVKTHASRGLAALRVGLGRERSEVD